MGYKEEITEWNKMVSYQEETKLTKDLQNAGFSNKEIVEIIGIISDTCHNCWNGKRNCQCENDR